mmetsp:Transcript_146957/g.366530  ORF Transcript_146957/g.366530 Transcript_146957/m.366530 type:complete len:434 (-) Transcript_146957:67-1368(-)
MEAQAAMFIGAFPSLSSATALLLALATAVDAASAPARPGLVHLLLFLLAAAYAVAQLAGNGPASGKLPQSGCKGQDAPRLLGRHSAVAAPLKPQGKEAHASAAYEARKCIEPRHEDPFRWSFIPSTGTNRSHGVYEHETDLCFLRMYVMGRPVHDRQRVADQDFPSAWHFEGRKRMWEVRMQLRFKQVPKGPLFLGLEYTTYQPLSAFIRRAEALIVASVSRIMGPVYKSPGDDPAAMGDAEAEPPCAAVPVYAFDQLVVSEAGEEPDITSSLEGLGWLRADGLAAYRRQVEATVGAPSTDKVYTLCTWSVSQMIDTINWTVGIPGGLRLDATKLAGAPPTIAALYELDDIEGSELDAQQEKRHLISRRRYYARFAYWSALRPPQTDHLRKVLQLQDTPATQDTVERDVSSGWGSLGWLERWSQFFCCVSPRN